MKAAVPIDRVLYAYSDITIRRINSYDGHQIDLMAIYRKLKILTIVCERLREIGSYCEKMASDIFNAIIETALQHVGLSNSNGVTVLA
jgi:hypothetical protein